MAGGTTDKDQGLNVLLTRLEWSKGLTLTVGVHGAEGGEIDGKGPLTILQVATVHEFGLGNNPERSFIRSWYDEKLTEHTEALRKIGAAVVKGQFTAQVGLERAGNLFVAEVQAKIASNIVPPLKKETSDRKGSTVALVDTGQMKASIRFKITTSKDL
jgi:hypothetical protein